MLQFIYWLYWFSNEYYKTSVFIKRDDMKSEEGEGKEMMGVFLLLGAFLILIAVVFLHYSLLVIDWYCPCAFYCCCDCSRSCHTIWAIPKKTRKEMFKLLFLLLLLLLLFFLIQQTELMICFLCHQCHHRTRGVKQLLIINCSSHNNLHFVVVEEKLNNQKKQKSCLSSNGHQETWHNKHNVVYQYNTIYTHMQTYDNQLSDNKNTMRRRCSGDGVCVLFCWWWYSSQITTAHKALWIILHYWLMYWYQWRSF